MRNMKISNILLLFCLTSICLLSACNSVDKQEYVSWLQNSENEFHQQRSINSITLDVQYADSAYQKIKDNVEEPIAHVFYIHILGDSKNRELVSAVSAENYSYFSFSFEKDIYIEKDNKKYPCKLFHYEQSHGKLGELYFIVGFELQDSKSSPIKLVINPEPLQTGPVKFTFDLSKLPLVE